MVFKDKSESLAEKMGKLTGKFSDSIEVSEEIVDIGSDLIEYVDGKTKDIVITSEIINLKNMVIDFKYVRETLKQNTISGRIVLNAITLDLLNSKDTKRASLIMSFTELNKAVAENMKLYINSYKEISSVLLNLNKMKDDNYPRKGKEKIINTTEIISTAELIKKLNKG